MGSCLSLEEAGYDSLSQMPHCYGQEEEEVQGDHFCSGAHLTLRMLASASSVTDRITCSLQVPCYNPLIYFFGLVKRRVISEVEPINLLIFN